MTKQNEEISSDEIFNSYLAERCPQCNEKHDERIGYTDSGGKCMAEYFRCYECGCEYTIGFKRRRMPIESSITKRGDLND